MVYFYSLTLFLYCSDVSHRKKDASALFKMKAWVCRVYTVHSMFSLNETLLTNFPSSSKLTLTFGHSALASEGLLSLVNSVDATPRLSLQTRNFRSYQAC